jgi:peptidoglycan/xylan/chitin deacetylase (PgdA/CDA1 family)
MIKNALSQRERAVHVSQKTFERQIRILSRKGYYSLSLEELYRSFVQGESLPKKSVIITFDDGYLDNYELAFPVLKKYGFTATIFIPTDLVDRDNHNTFKDRYLMSWKEIREMHGNGIFFASHTATHPRLTELSNNEIRIELTRSKKKLEDFFDKECNFVAYPYGKFNQQVKDLALEAGYKGACSTKIGLNRPSDDMMTLKRISIIDLDNPSRLLRKVMFGLWDVPWSLVPKYYVRRAMERIGAV